MSLESDLYAPIKALLEGQGYSVKGEVKGCDVVAVRGQEPPVIVELKRAFGISLVLQGVARLTITDNVYLAVGAFPNNIRSVRKLIFGGLAAGVERRVDAPEVHDVGELVACHFQSALMFAARASFVKSVICSTT